MQKKEPITDRERLTQLVDQLTLEEQAVVIQLLKVMVGNRSKKHSVKEMKGLGKEIWKDVDPQDYIDELRGPRCG